MKFSRCDKEKKTSPFVGDMEYRRRACSCHMSHMSHMSIDVVISTHFFLAILQIDMNSLPSIIGHFGSQDFRVCGSEHHFPQVSLASWLSSQVGYF